MFRLIVAGGGDADAFCNPLTESWRLKHFYKTSIAEDQAFKFVVDHDFQRYKNASVAETPLHFLRLVERF